MKYFEQFAKILSFNQKRSFFVLIFFMFFSMSFEILTLGTLFVLLNFLTDPINYENSNPISFIKNLDLDFPLHLQILVFSF